MSHFLDAPWNLADKKKNVDFSTLPIVQNSEVFRTQETHATNTVTLNIFRQIYQNPFHIADVLGQRASIQLVKCCLHSSR